MPVAPGTGSSEREIVEWLCIALLLGPTRRRRLQRRCEQLLEDADEDRALEPTVLVRARATSARCKGESSKRTSCSSDGERPSMGSASGSGWSRSTSGSVSPRDDPVAAERELRPGYEALKRIGEKSHFSSVTGLLVARALLRAGSLRRGRAAHQECEEAARPNDVHSQILWRATRAKVLAHRGELVAAEALASEAVAFAAESDFLDSHGDALMSLAEVLLLADRQDDAGTALEQAASLYALKGNIVSAAKARARLGSISRM